jgi:branched-chain amino acid transport system permease protein
VKPVGWLARNRWAVVGLLALVALPFLLANDYYLNLLIVIGVYCIALLGLDLIKGYTGLLSLGQAGFMGVAAYVSAILTTRFEWEPLAALLVAILAVLMVALLMAVPGSRLTGFNLALATLGFAIITEGLFLGLRELTGGASGISGVPQFRVLGFVFRTEAANFWLIWGVFAALMLLARNIVDSPTGQALRAIKEDALAAASLGIDVFRYRIQIFLIAAVYAALAGSLFVHYMRFIAPDMVNWVVSTALVTMLVVGGEGTLWGVLLGAALLRLLPEIFNPLQDYLLIVQGLALILTMIYLPGGLAGAARALAQRRRASRVPAAERETPSPAGARPGVRAGGTSSTPPEPRRASDLEMPS